ncbi:MAG: hypothetical protein E6H07_05065 [Bacteroidetes bacterium]|nr:MAG: hypothetical protein E6H07_05065 [Bacteroidota bacterium]
MQKTKAPSSVDEYIASFPDETKKRLIQLQKAIKSVAPKAEELISYGIAGYKHHGVLIYFAGWKNHISLYPAPWNAAELKKEMLEYKGAKGTIKFSSDKPLPLQLIRKIVKYKLEENELKAGLKKKTEKPSDDENVKEWIANLDTATKKQIDAVRSIIKTASPKLNERIKWNAPSYYYKEDIVTFGPSRKKDQVLLVFHHSNIIKIKSALLEGNYKDRRLVYFNSPAEITAGKKELGRIVKEMVKMIK